MLRRARVLIATALAGSGLTSGPLACSSGNGARLTTVETSERMKPDLDPLAPAAPASPRPAYPSTRRDDIVDELHGVQVADPYRWLEDTATPGVKTWMEAQHALTRRYLDELPRREQIAARLREVLYYDALSAPLHTKGRYFWTRKHKDKEKDVVYWKQGEDGATQVLFDPNTWSADGSISLGGWWPTQDGARAAYNVNENASDEATMYLIDVATGEKLADVIPGTKYSGASWTPDGKAFYYTWVPPISDQVPIAERPGFAEIRFHRVGTDPAKDATVFPATGNPQSFVAISISKDGRWLIATVWHGWNSSDVYVQDLKKKQKDWTPLIKSTDALYTVTPWRDRLYVLTNEGAPRFRIFQADPTRPGGLDRGAWQEIVAQVDSTLESASILGEHLVLTYLRNAASEMEIRDLDGRRLRTVELPPLGTVSSVAGQPDEDTAYFGYTSFTEPSVIYQTSIKTGAVTEWARVTLPIDTSKLVAEQVRYPSKDGTEITMFLIRGKDTQRDGARPTILYGYGGFSVSMTPDFSSSWAVWIEQGGMVAVPNLRGGGEYGEDWHKDGMLLKKQNVFDDFISAARYLIAEKWTSPSKLAIRGGSNGGLLVGAAMTQAPELFKAVICAVPLLDMIRFHRFGSGKTWVPEYGSAEDPEQFKVLLAYSPYHRAQEGTAYPALLMLSADSDDRVDPMHARKFIAQIQHASTSAAPALLRIETNAGHGGADLVKQKVAENSDAYAFLIQQLGM